MGMKKWKPTRDAVPEMAEWFKDHFPICQTQELWDMSQSKERAKHYLDSFWESHKDYFRKMDIRKKDVNDTFEKVIIKFKIYPYKKRKALTLNDVHYEVAKILSRQSSNEIMTPLEETETDQSSGKQKKIYRGPVARPTEIEDDLINEIEPDIERLKREGMSVEDISKKTGLSKSTIYRRLKKPKK